MTADSSRPENKAADAAANRWRAVAAALADGRRLELYGRIITAASGNAPLDPAQLGRAEAKSLAVLEKTGLVSVSGAAVLASPGVFSRLLESGRPRRDTSPLRFLASGGSGSLPSKRTDRLELLHHLAGEVFSQHGELTAGTDPAASGAKLTEGEVTSRLAAYTEDPAMVRRALVDEGIVRRSPDGGRYWLVRPRPSDGMEFARG